MPETVSLDAVGCWIDSHWGQYGVAQMVSLAASYGYYDPEVIDIAERHLASMGPSREPDITADESELLMDAAPSVEEWMIDNIAPNGYWFGWWEGEFHLQSEAWWEEASY